MAETPTLTPKAARRYSQVLQLRRDNVSSGRAWIMVDHEDVTVVMQKHGHPATGKVKLTRADFERFARWYETGETRAKAKTPRPRKAAVKKR